MFKKTHKIFAVLIIMMIVMATSCFATEDTPVVTSEVVDETETTTEEHNHEEDATASAEQKLHEDDLYVIEDTVTMDKLVDSNAFIIGSDVTVTGQVGGDLFVIADNLTLTGDSYIYGNLFACANTITVEGIVCDLYAISENLTLAETGIVLRDIRTAGSNLTINGSIGRNTYVTATSISLGENSHVYGDFNYTAKEAIQVPSGVVDGTINYSEMSVSEESGNTVMSYVMDCIYAVVYAIAVLAIMILVAPKFLNRLPEFISKKSLPTIGIGVLGLIVPIPVAILLMISVVGVPVAFALLAVWAIAVFALSSAVTTIAIASFIGSKVAVLGKAHNILSVVLVSIVLWALAQIPVGIVQFILGMLITSFGLGCILVSIFKRNKKEVVE